MTFAELTAELVARGAQNNATRNGRWINQAYRAIWNYREWPFALKNATSATPDSGFVLVPDMRKITGVWDATNYQPGRPLQKTTTHQLTRDGVWDFAQSGEPQWWYWDGVAGAVLTFPLSGTITVEYYSRVDVLTGVQVPAFDEEYHHLIVDRAMVEVYKDADELAAAEKALNAWYIEMAQMVDDYMDDAVEPMYIDVVDPYDG